MTSNFKKDFPFIINNQNDIYFDSAATTHRPAKVINAIKDFLEKDYATVSRGLYTKSVEATMKYESVRAQVADFISVPSPNEIIFTPSATQSINLVAQSWGRANLNADDCIILSEMEHHANIVPWRQLADEIGFNIFVTKLNSKLELDLNHFKKLLEHKPKLVSIVHLSNVLGALNPVKEICALAKEVGAVTLIDGCQAVSDNKVDVKDMGCDFYVFSGHKIYGPNGIGVLYGREEILKDMPPFIGGGDMIEDVSFEKITYLPAPHRFEAGTPNIEGVIGLGAALTYLSDIGMDKVYEYKSKLIALIKQGLASIERVEMLGGNHHGLISFQVRGLHVHDVGSMMAAKNIALRAGQHCAQPLFDSLGISGSLRVSVGLYNDESDVEKFINALKDVIAFFEKRGL